MVPGELSHPAPLTVHRKSGAEMATSSRRRGQEHFERARKDHKRGKIAALVSRAVSTERSLQGSFGVPTFIEFWVTNKSTASSGCNYTIQTNGQGFQVVESVDEWRAWHSAVRSTSAAPAARMFQRTGGNKELTLFLKSGERVAVPLVLRPMAAVESAADWEISSDSAGRVAVRSADTGGPRSKTELISTTRIVAENGSTAALLQINTCPVPFTVTKVMRFWHQHGGYLKQSIPIDQPDHAFDELDDTVCRVYCSRPDIVCQYVCGAGGAAVLIKALVGRAPSTDKFFVAVTADKYGIKLREMWDIRVHAVERVEVSGTFGQTINGMLSVDTGQALPAVRCVSSDPQLQMGAPDQPTSEVASRVHRLPYNYTATAPGATHHLVHVLEEMSDRLIMAFVVSFSIRPPDLTDTYTVELPRLKRCTKQISYQNPYRQARTYTLLTDRPDLLEFKSTNLEVRANESVPIRIRFLPTRTDFSALVFVNAAGKTEDCFSIQARID